MRHALILDDNMIISRAIQESLAPLGFVSFDHVWTEQQAVEAATHCSPDLIVVGDTIVGGSPLSAAQRISSEHDAPILIITADRCRVHRRFPENAAVMGSYYLHDIENALGP